MQWDIFGQAPLHVAIGNMNSRGNNNPARPGPPEQGHRPRGRARCWWSAARIRTSRPTTGAAGRATSAVTGRGTTPFLAACANGDIEIVKLLLAHGANPKLATSDGQGPIILGGRARAPAARGFPNPGGRSRAGVAAPRSAKRPVAMTVRPTRRPERGKGPRVNPTVELIKLLAASGADVNLMAKRHFLQRTRGGSALHYAVRERQQGSDGGADRPGHRRECQG